MNLKATLVFGDEKAKTLNDELEKLISLIKKLRHFIFSKLEDGIY